MVTSIRTPKLRKLHLSVWGRHAEIEIVAILMCYTLVIKLLSRSRISISQWNLVVMEQ